MLAGIVENTAFIMVATVGGAYADAKTRRRSGINTFHSGRTLRVRLRQLAGSLASWKIPH